MAAVAYESVSSKSQLKQGFTKVVVTIELVAYKSGGKESFDCIFIITTYTFIHEFTRQNDSRLDWL